MSQVSVPLLSWYDQNARVLPWRKPPKTGQQDPYRAWLAEVMLQQTTVAAVLPYYAHFLERWPTVQDLAAAPDEEVMTAWAGLGYYARARNMLAAARAVSAIGAFPETEEGLRALPGIGAYTAAAVAAIAFDEPAAVVDGYVNRVFSRLVAADPALSLKAMTALVKAQTPELRAGDFAQAVMDLGATICRPKSPRCGECPLMAQCEGQKTGEPERFPIKVPKKQKPKRDGSIWIAFRGEEVLVVTRPPSGLLGGTLAFPSSGWDGSMAEPPMALDWKNAGTAKQVFTHFSAEVDVFWAEAPSGAKGMWRKPDPEWRDFPSLMRKAGQRAGAARSGS